KVSSLENHPHKTNSIRYFLIIIVNSSLRLDDLNYGLFFHLRSEVAQRLYNLTKEIKKMYPNERLFDNNKVSLRGQNRRTYISLSYVIEFTFSQIWLLNDLFKKYLKIL
ncbi:unnamed protein product, partial [Brassica rapa subsp. narinosa]